MEALSLLVGVSVKTEQMCGFVQRQEVHVPRNNAYQAGLL